jgi:hypothetical protein
LREVKLAGVSVENSASYQRANKALTNRETGCIVKALRPADWQVEDGLLLRPPTLLASIHPNPRMCAHNSTPNLLPASGMSVPKVAGIRMRQRVNGFPDALTARSAAGA